MYNNLEKIKRSNKVPTDWSIPLKSEKWELHPKTSFFELRSMVTLLKTTKHIKLEDNLSKYKEHILGLQDNWDDQGSKGFTEEIWDRSIDLLKKILGNLWTAMYDIPIPLVLPNSDGSLDLEWETDEFELLVNLPPNEKDLVHFYGEKIGFPEYEIDTRTNYDFVSNNVVEWLKKIL